MQTDQHMGHFFNIADHIVAGDILAHAKADFGFAVPKFRGINQIPNGHCFGNLVGRFDAYGQFIWYHGNTDAGGA